MSMSDGVARNARRTILGRFSKRTLVEMHRDNGGLMRVSEYMAWTKEELVNAIIEDEFGPEYRVETGTSDGMLSAMCYMHGSVQEGTGILCAGTEVIGSGWPQREIKEADGG